MTKCNVHETALTWLVYELLSCRFGRFRLHTSLRLRALIRSWQGVYVCKFRSTRTRFQFKKTLPGEHSPENFCCVGPHFQACMNLADVFCLRCFSEARKKHFRRNFRKCSRMRAIDRTFILKEEQRNAIKAFVKRKDVFAFLPSYGIR